MLLAGDIGGTKTVLALFEESEGDLRKVRESTFPSRAYETFDKILLEFLASAAEESPRAACFGVAGIVVDGHSDATNLAWSLDERALGPEIGVPRVKLLNDLEAAAYGMLYLGPDERSILQAGTAGRRTGNVAVIAAGTGLGEAMLFWDGEHYHPIASEGGHADFAPTSALEIELLLYLRDKFGGHVSWERVLSGPGIHNLYEFLRDRGHGVEAPEVAEQLLQGDPNATIAGHALAGTDPLSVAAVDLFCSVYGAEAGNLALRCVATGGVIIGGGIAPKILSALTKGAFTRSFAAKGRLSPLLSSIEVSVALDPRAPLIGAAHYAARL